MYPAQAIIGAIFLVTLEGYRIHNPRKSILLPLPCLPPIRRALWLMCLAVCLPPPLDSEPLLVEINFNKYLGVMKYWQIKQVIWPELAAMALDLLAVPAISSECERVFSSCAKMTTPESRKLLGKTLWHYQCLKNWQRWGAIKLALYNNSVELDFGSDGER